MYQYGDCSFCGGEVKEELVELDYRYKGKLYVFRNVPVGGCQQCGERYLKADVAKAIENDIRTRVCTNFCAFTQRMLVNGGRA